MEDDFLFGAICNATSVGGVLTLDPNQVDMSDGLLEVLLVKQVSRLQVARVIGMYKNGRYRELSHLIRHIRTDRVVIHCDRETPINLDGELRMAKDIEMSVAKEKLRFFYPRGLHW